MGKIKQGILGGFNGTTGSVVGASWKGIAYMRGKAQSIKNPRTTSQQEVRTLFGSISDIMGKALTAVNYGYAGLASKKSPFNVAVQENVKAMRVDAPDVIFTSLKFSNGSLVPVIAGSVTLSEGHISVGFSVSETTSTARDFCGVAVFEGDFPGAPFVSVGSVILSADASSGTILLNIPNGVEYTKAHCYVFEYRVAEKLSSLTTYCGDYIPA